MQVVSLVNGGECVTLMVQKGFSLATSQLSLRTSNCVAFFSVRALCFLLTNKVMKDDVNWCELYL